MSLFEDLNPETQENLLNYLASFMAPHRWELMKNAVSNRTRHLTVALEDIFQSHNAAAVLRSCDSFGIQDVHIIENRNRFRIRTRQITKGADKWLNLNKFNNPDENNTLSCIQHLKSQGYRVIAADLTPDAVSLDQLDISHPTAILIGTEMAGVSPTARQLCDGAVKIPMVGFSQSLNLSVCAAIILHSLTQKMKAQGLNWQLPTKMRLELLYQWLSLCISNHESIAKTFLSKL